jgi:RHS repeat-associated protein
LTQISYNSVSGVSTAPTVTYNYDHDYSANTTSIGSLMWVGVGTDYQEHYTYDSQLRLSSTSHKIGTRTYTTSYNSYNEANQLTGMTYPSGRNLYVDHDSLGRLSGLVEAGAGRSGTPINYLSSVSYNLAGQVTGDSFGNGVTEQFGYDAARLQMTSQKAGTTSPYTNRMDLSYSYSATTSGQFGVGTTAGNAGQLMGITNTSTINGSTESASYTYDNYGRLATSNQTSNGQTAQRRFDYDRWGNRTAVWDATSGGNQIQQVVLAQTSGIPSNHIENLPGATNNLAAASNGATASASSTYSSSATPASGAINGDHKGSNWGSGGGWSDNTANSYPDWLQVDFSGIQTINEIDVYSIQDNYSSPSEPDETTQFNDYGVTAFQVQYWDGNSWQTVTGGSISGNKKVWRKVRFPSLKTGKIRIYITGTIDGLSRLAEVEAYGYEYDAAGNVTCDGQHSYFYDSENRLTSVDGGAAGYAYDQQNRRYKKTVGSTVTHVVWQGSQVMSEHNGSTGAALVDYIYSGGRMIAKIASGTTSYFLSDRLSARLTLNTSGAVVGRQAHLPFGEDFAESGTQQKQHFTGYERDSETGTDYAINRQYNQSVGRFDQLDPVVGTGPERLNRYTYSKNDPINVFDPMGTNLEFVDCRSGYYYDPDGGWHIGQGWEVCEVGDSGPGESYDTGDIGPGSGMMDFPLVDPTKLTDALKMANKLLKRKECDEALKDYGIPSLAALFNGLKFSGADANVFDGRTSSLKLPIGPNGSTQTVADYFKANKGKIGATVFHNVNGGEVTFLGFDFFSPEKPKWDTQQRAIILLHEAVHQIGKKGDAGFPGGSSGLSELIIAGCYPALKGQLGGIG